MALDATEAEEVELLVPGMRCGGCMGKVEKALLAVPGVLDARANLTERRVHVRVGPGTMRAEGLVSALEAKGFEARPPDETLRQADEIAAEGRDLLIRIGVAGFAAMNVMLLSISVWSGADGATRDLLHWVSALIALPAIAYAGRPFFASAAAALAAGRLNMEVPISLAVLFSATGSVIETARSGQHAYFDAAVMLLFFLLIGRWLELRSRRGARSAAAELGALLPRETTVVENGARRRLPLDALRPGMEIALAAGDRVPADGTVLTGESEIDRSLVTGEYLPEPAAPGTQLNAGMLNLTGALGMRVTATGDTTLLADIARMVDAAGRARAKWDGWADRAARIYAPGVHILAFAAFVGWWFLGMDWAASLQIACAVLIITCPCALALAVPTVHAVASSRLLRAGIFLKDGAEFERLADIDMVALDKTGTLTDGAPVLIKAPDPADPAWAVARALAEASRHPLALAIAEAAGHAAPAPLTNIREVPGQGVEGRLNGTTIRLGRPGWAGAERPGAGTSAILTLPDGREAVFRFGENLRPDAVQTCAALSKLGVGLAVLSGDRHAAVAAVAADCGIDEIHAELLPGDKVALLAGWRAEGRKVLMVGDGLNDGPALAAAHASMSPAEAADASRAAAGLVWTGKRLMAVAHAIQTARTARRRAFESFGIAAVYNAVAIPLAVAGFVTPLIAALAMSGSSIAVTLNALRMGGRT